jgi:hypothetical protein
MITATSPRYSSTSSAKSTPVPEPPTQTAEKISDWSRTRRGRQQPLTRSPSPANGSRQSRIAKFMLLRLERIIQLIMPTKKRSQKVTVART